MKVHRFKNTDPLTGHSRETPKLAHSREQADGDARSDAINALSNSIDMLLFRKSKITSRVTGETVNGGDEAAEISGTDSAGTAGAENPANHGKTSSRIFLSMDSDQKHESREFKIARIRRNMAGGYYNSPEFIEKLADTLIKKLGFAEDSD